MSDNDGNLERELDELAQEGIACRVEGDSIVCTGEIIQASKQEKKISKIDFNVAAVRKLFEDKI